VCLFYMGNLWPLLHVDLFPFGNLWSLALEEQYYLIWPLFLLAVKKLKAAWVIGGVLLLTVVSLTLRFTGHVTTPAGYDRAYYLPHSSVWAILAGSAVALYIQHHRLSNRPPLLLPRWSWRVGVIGLVLVATVLGLRTGLYQDTSGFTLVTVLAAGPLAAVFAVVLVAHGATASAGSLPAWLTHPILLFFADISYALYLWHGTIDHSLASHFGGRGLANLAIGLVSAAIAIGVATASRRWVEAPFLRWKDRSLGTRGTDVSRADPGQGEPPRVWHRP
jgi:peptidoglycan/LPS O-acetylase OafA/YrhL